MMDGATPPALLYVYSRLRDTKTGEYGPMCKGVVYTTSLSYSEVILSSEDYKIDLYIEDYLHSNCTITSIELYNGSYLLTSTISDITSSDPSNFPKTWYPPHVYRMHLLTIDPEMIVTKIRITWSDNKSSFGLNVNNKYYPPTLFVTSLDYTDGESAGESYHEIDFQKGRILYKMSEATEPFVQEVHPLNTLQITDIPLNSLQITPADPVVLNTPTTATSTTIELTWIQTSDNDIPTTIYTIQYGTDNTTWVSEQTAASDTPYPVTNLSPGTKYYFRIIKENAFSEYVGAGKKYANVVSNTVDDTTLTS
jgi:hypothetical protein